MTLAENDCYQVGTHYSGMESPSKVSADQSAESSTATPTAATTEGRWDAFAESMFPRLEGAAIAPVGTIGDILGMSPSPKCFREQFFGNGLPSSSRALPEALRKLAPSNLVAFTRQTRTRTPTTISSGGGIKAPIPPRAPTSTGRPRGRPRKRPIVPEPSASSSREVDVTQHPLNGGVDVPRQKRSRKFSVNGEPAKKPKLTSDERSKLIIDGKRKAKERRAQMAAQKISSEPPVVSAVTRSLRRNRGSVPECNGYANLEWDPAAAIATHTSSSSRAAPFSFVQSQVLNPELEPKELNTLKEYEVKLIGRREPAAQPFPDLLYDITKVMRASEDSILFRTRSRQVWTSLVPEMSALSSEAGWRNRHLLAKHELHTYDSKPLRMDYIYDRIACDDPVDGWQIRCRHSGQLQGFLTYTFFMTYQPLIFRGDPPDLVRKLNRCRRQNSYWYGCAWPEVVELVLLGALGCGTVLMEEFLDSLANTEVKFVLIHATVHARGYYEKLGFQRVKACARYDVKNRELRTPTVTSAGYDGGYGFHMLLLQFMNDFLANLPLSPVLRMIAARADRGHISSIHQAWKALEPHIPHGNKMESKKLYDYYRNQYRVCEEFHIDVTAAGYLNAFNRDPACFPYHHWQFKSVTSSELEDPSLLLVLELDSWPGRTSTSKVCTVPVSEWKSPPVYRWIKPQTLRLSQRSLVYIVGGAPGIMSSFSYWYITELVPDLRWAHLVPMVEKGAFPLQSSRKGRTRYCLQPRQDRGRELSISMERLVPVPADCIRGKGNDPDQDIWDVKDFTPPNCQSV